MVVALILCSSAVFFQACNEQPEITPEVVDRTIVGKMVGEESSAWRFLPDEPRDIFILEQQVDGNKVVAVVQIETQSSKNKALGRLRLHYYHAGQEWRLQKVDNLSFSLVLGAESSRGPSEEQVRDDWEQYARSDRTCVGTVEFRKVQIIGRSIQENRAEILLEVTGDWVPNKHDQGWFAGPCNGFHKRNGRNQVVVNKAVYTKYDTGWRIEKSRLLGHAFSRVE
jgi:hypothetical protein